ncbi:tRNA pseudouridine(38-40) synthase [Lichtheimia ornata]|uniref:tRNA pseudouridine(38-40) synthase n=1 Tax=Lichtheimia ornata TaxID=688661 RepID=A0AAD7UTZ8_9FUNG|nr:tRNA pseudouridine(38-40) synthase [Lichtheimia ornata]KAJ8652256.1 tRNA pseudouridine(38-40) synthase [Lichtheimia ornata]
MLYNARLAFSLTRSFCTKPQRLHKTKVALMLGFNGTGFQGMQYNPSIRSIEQTLFEALCKAGAVSELNSMDPKKIQMARAARTDKGVHAVGNVVSAKLVVEDPDIVSKINQHLPDQIKVWGYTPVTGGFHAKKACNGREYEYWLPTYTLEMPPSRSLHLRSSREHPSDLYIAEENAYIPVSTRESIAEKHQCRISSTKLEQFRDAMAVFQGTHNFHNYTIQRNSSDPSANRYIMRVEVGQPKQFDGMEWVNVKLRGQSFMLHQIRKMIAMAMLVTRTDTPTSVISQSFEHHKINIPKAPALGLLLEKPLFDGYNQRIADRPDRSPISFDSYKDAMDEFKERWIIDEMLATEKEQNLFDRFLLYMDAQQTGPVFSYLNKEGCIPPEAILTF